MLHHLVTDAGLRALLAGATALAVCLAAGRPTIAWLRRLKVGERTEKTPIEDEALRARIAAKSGTPTMGGLMVLAALLAACALWADVTRPPMATLLGATLALAGLGAVDDLMKLHGKGRRDRGLKIRHKLLIQFLIGGAAGLLLAGRLHSAGPGAAPLALPWGAAGRWTLLLAPLWTALMVMGMSNATNVTDGLDGLLAGLAAPAAAVLGVACWAAGTPAAAEMAVYCGAVTGACLGFLWFNRHPARMIMGDTGALALGGGLALAAVVARLEVVLALVGVVFLAELGSSLLQIGFFKAFKRRILPMAPLHHIFELRGHPEGRIVRGFYLWGAVAALLGLNLICL